MSSLRSLFCLLLLTSCGGGGSVTPPPPPQATIDPRAFLYTRICGDGSLWVLNQGCQYQVAQGATPVVTWRYDWAHPDQAQVQNTYVLDDGSGWVATFSYPPHLAFDAANGDGGDVFVYDGETVRISYTQNGDGRGGTAAGWWVGARCGGTGWVSFDKYTGDQGWREWLAKLRGATDPQACPSSLDSAYTRARVVRGLPVYLVLQDLLGNVTTRTVPLDAVVTEHYAGPTLAGATQMERQVHVANVGPSVYWEAWVKNPPEQPAAYQCPGAEGWNGPPDGSGWVLWDRRCRTVVRTADPVITGDQWGWPPPDAVR